MNKLGKILTGGLLLMLTALNTFGITMPHTGAPQFAKFAKLAVPTAHQGQTQTPYTYCGAWGAYYEGGHLYHMKARYYRADIARFLSADPLGTAGGLNLYAYANGNPIIFLDALGLCPESGGYPGGWVNPGNWWRGVYTGNPNATDEVYAEAMDGASDALLETYPGGGFAIGTSAQGGGGVGGQAGGGIVVAVNWADVIQLGTYTMAGVGSYIGAGGSLTVDVTILPGDDIGDLHGASGTFGGSAGTMGVTAGAEVNVPINGGTSYTTFSLGLGGNATSAEGHGFITGTDVYRVLH